MTGYLPSLVTGETPFKGNPVFVLESNRYYDPVWFYDSPLPERFDPIFAAHQTEGVPNTSTKEEDRKSFLATPLFLDTDFWINLPVYTDHQVLGVNGALVNATLWNASNTARFFRSPATAPAAVAEMSAIPELRETWLFSIASLEHYQFIGGPVLQFPLHEVRAAALAQHRSRDDGRPHAGHDQSLAQARGLRAHLGRHPHARVRARRSASDRPSSTTRR